MKLRVHHYHRALACLVLCWLLWSSQDADAGVITWDGSTSNAWLTGTNWSGDQVPSGLDVARFASTTTPGATSTTAAGISMSGATNNGLNNQAVGAIVVDAAQGANALFIGNSSTSASGVLTLNGTNVNGIPQAIFVLGGTGGVTMQNAVNGGTRNMTVNLATAGANVVQQDGSAGTFEIKNNITGVGGLELRRASTSSTAKFLLSGSNSYAGNTTIGSARLRVNGGSAVPNGVGKGDVMMLSPNSWFETFTDETINGLSGQGLVDNGNTTAVPVTLTVGDNNASSTFAGRIANTSNEQGSIMNLRKIGNGALTLTGTNTYRGSTTVSQGTLIVDSAHKEGFKYTVDGAGILGGGGVISAPVDLNGGLSPGDAIGTLSIGRLNANSGSTFNFQLNPTNSTVGAGVNDYLHVTGLLNLSGASSLNFNIEKIGTSAFNSSGSWTLASYDALRVTGTSAFDPGSIHVSGLTGFSPSINFVPQNPSNPYGPGAVTLSLSPSGSSPAPIQPSFNVTREVYIPHTEAGVAPKSEMHAPGPGLFRAEYLFFLSGQSDRFTNSGVRYSNDNGRTWSAIDPFPDFEVHYTTPSGQTVSALEADHEPIYDPVAGALIKPWTRQITNNGVSYIHSYYSFSRDAGAHWTTPEPLKYESGADFNPADPLNTAYLTTNVGQRGQSFYALANGTVMVGLGYANDPNDPANAGHVPKLGVLNMVGTWNTSTLDYDWSPSNIAAIPGELSQGLGEPDMAQLKDGRVLTIWRGRNTTSTAGHKWFTVSSPDALTISTPAELKYDDGTPFFSPSAMHMLVRNTVNGILYWFGNILGNPPNGNQFRHPLVIAEVDEDLVALKRDTVTIIADQLASEDEFVQYSNFTVFENPETHQFELYLTNLGADASDIYNADALKFTINVLPPVAVPEPGSWALLLAGTVTALVGRKRFGRFATRR